MFFFQNLQYSIGLSLQVGDASDLQVLARLSDCNVYTALNARSQFRAPTEFGLCLAGGREALRCLACETERARTCWLTAMRLAKVSQDRWLLSIDVCTLLFVDTRMNMRINERT
jgi:hypothetical protein